MVRIRLRRTGSKRQPTYRIVVTDKEAPRDGAFIEVIGTYNPRTQPESVKIEEERALHWMRVGAQPSDSVKQLLTKTGTVARYQRLMKGESSESLVAEAIQSAAPMPSARTRVGRATPKRTTPFVKKG
jgi:small subunit ribosomal protein S16